MSKVIGAEGNGKRKLRKGAPCLSVFALLGTGRRRKAARTNDENELYMELEN